MIEKINTVSLSPSPPLFLPPLITHTISKPTSVCTVTFGKRNRLTAREKYKLKSSDIENKLNKRN